VAEPPRDGRWISALALLVCVIYGAILGFVLGAFLV